MRGLYSDLSLKQLKKMGKSEAKRIINYMKEIEELDNPRVRGQAIVENLKGFWRYRVGDWRVICDIVDEEIIIHVIEVGHRREVYK